MHVSVVRRSRENTRTQVSVQKPYRREQGAVCVLSRVHRIQGGGGFCCLILLGPAMPLQRQHNQDVMWGAEGEGRIQYSSCACTGPGMIRTSTAYRWSGGRTPWPSVKGHPSGHQNRYRSGPLGHTEIPHVAKLLQYSTTMGAHNDSADVSVCGGDPVRVPLNLFNLAI